MAAASTPTSPLAHLLPVFPAALREALLSVEGGLGRPLVRLADRLQRGGSMVDAKDEKEEEDGGKSQQKLPRMTPGDLQEELLAIREICWENLHTGPWDQVDDVWREAYAQATICYVSMRLTLAEQDSSDCAFDSGPKREAGSKRKRAQTNISARTGQDHSTELFSECLDMLDRAIMMSPPHSRGPMQKMAIEIHQVLADRTLLKPELWGRNQTSSSSTIINRNSDTKHESSIRRIDGLPSLFEFEQFAKEKEPFVISRGCCGWPAFQKWKDLRYVRQICGWRSVPVEVGSTYLDDKWSQKIMKMNEFLDRFVVGTWGFNDCNKSRLRTGEETPEPKRPEPKHPEPTRPEPKRPKLESAREIAYLAQHDLFDQIPALKRDIIPFDYTVIESFSECEEDDNVRLNIWFGPCGTVSPLHYDPQHNLLAQVVGAKRVCLIPPRDSEFVYPCTASMMKNTSQVDIESPNLSKFPLFSRAETKFCTLEAGDVLYIPPGYWHHLRSLTGSISVSSWFGMKEAPQLKNEQKQIANVLTS